MQDKALTGMTALVTGASQGIGFASARALARDGAVVVVMGRREGALTEACDRLRAEAPGARIEMFAGDATDEADVKAALAHAHGLAGRLDIVAAVVGHPTFMPILMRDLEGVRREIDLNFVSAFLAVRHGAPLMQRGGAIVCVSSDGATQSGWGLGVYGAMKAAVERFVRAAAYELAGAGIRVNAVRPGCTIPPERIAAEPALGGTTQAYVDATPMGRLGHPDDVARVLRFLAGPEFGLGDGRDRLGRRRARPQRGAGFHGRLLRQGSDGPDPRRQAGRPEAVNIGRAVLVAIDLVGGPDHVDVGIGAVGALAAVDDEEAAIGVAFVDQVVAVLDALRPGADVARAQCGPATILDQHRFAGQHHQQFVFAGVPVALRGPGAGLQHDMARADFAQPGDRRQPAVPAAGDRLVERRRVAGAVGLGNRREIELGHGRAPVLAVGRLSPYAGPQSCPCHRPSSNSPKR